MLRSTQRPLLTDKGWKNLWHHYFSATKGHAIIPWVCVEPPVNQELDSVLKSGGRIYIQMLCFLTQLSPMSPLTLPALIEPLSAKLCDKHQEDKDCLNTAVSLRQSSGKWPLFSILFL